MSKGWFWDQKNQTVRQKSPVIRDLALLAVALIIAGMWGCPQYKVWQQGLAGEAELKRAEQNRRVRVLEAQANLDSAKLLNQAEVERAKGVADANKIIAEGLGGPEGYLRYLWIQGLNDGKG